MLSSACQLPQGNTPSLLFPWCVLGSPWSTTVLVCAGMCLSPLLHVHSERQGCRAIPKHPSLLLTRLYSLCFWRNVTTRCHSSELQSYLISLNTTFCLFLSYWLVLIPLRQCFPPTERYSWRTVHLTGLLPSPPAMVPRAFSISSPSWRLLGSVKHRPLPHINVAFEVVSTEDARILFVLVFNFLFFYPTSLILTSFKY